MDGFDEWLSKYPNVVVDTYGLYMKAAWQESTKQLQEAVAWYFECDDVYWSDDVRDPHGHDELGRILDHAEQQLREMIDAN